MLNVMHVSATDLQGGAARAALRIHRSLQNYNACDIAINSYMRVINKISEDQSIIGGIPKSQNSTLRKLQSKIGGIRYKKYVTSNQNLHSIAWPSTGLGEELTRYYDSKYIDLINLHWINNDTISIEEIGNLQVPIVWTLHDQWAFCGAEHYTSFEAAHETINLNERFINGYNKRTRPAYEHGPDLNKHTWDRKKRAWKQPIQIVCPSNWLANCAKKSSLMSEWPIRVIPCPLDTDIWLPVDKLQARKLLGLPLNAQLILFGAIGGIRDYRKGADLMLGAIQVLNNMQTKNNKKNIELVIFGQNKPRISLETDFPIHYKGLLHDDISLRLLYASADVMVVPSREEAFGQTASEAQACGVPVVAFQIGGLLEIIQDKVTGSLAIPFDPESLAKEILWVLDNSERRQQLSVAARKRAIELFNSQRIANMYIDVYQQIIGSKVRKER